MAKKKNKEPLTAKQNKKRYKRINFLSKGFIGLTTVGGFVGYQSYINWDNFQEDLENFVLVEENSMKLNVAVAMPFLIAMLVYLFVMRKKNKDFFRDKASLGLFIAILITYAFYSIAQALLFSLIGAFVGVIFDEWAFTPLSQKYKEDFEERIS
jgi:hypothetical protein